MTGIFQLTCQPFCGRHRLWLQPKESRHESKLAIDTASAGARHPRVGLAADSDDRSAGEPKWVGAERGALWVRFSTPPVAAAPETFTSCSYRTEVLFRLRFMTGELVEDLKIRHDISLGRSFEQMTRFDMIHLVLIPGNRGMYGIRVHVILTMNTNSVHTPYRGVPPCPSWPRAVPISTAGADRARCSAWSSE